MNYDDMLETPVVIETYYPEIRRGLFRRLERKAFTTIEYGYLKPRLNKNTIAIGTENSRQHIQKKNIQKIRVATEVEQLLIEEYE